MTILPALILGLALGVRHATDADHLAAVSTIAAGGCGARDTALVGAWWGVGHSASVLLVGGALVLLRLSMPARVALALEFLVALMLISLGLRALVARRPDRAPHPRGSPLRPLVVGLLHGLAGSAVLALLVIAATPSAWVGAAYLVSFCLGATVGMALVSALFALPARLGTSRGLRVNLALRFAAGVVSIGVGLSMAHRIGVRDGLFAAAPSAASAAAAP